MEEVRFKDFPLSCRTILFDKSSMPAVSESLPCNPSDMALRSRWLLELRRTGRWSGNGLPLLGRLFRELIRCNKTFDVRYQSDMFKYSDLITFIRNYKSNYNVNQILYCSYSKNFSRKSRSSFNPSIQKILFLYHSCYLNRRAIITCRCRDCKFSPIYDKLRFDKLSCILYEYSLSPLFPSCNILINLWSLITGAVFGRPSIPNFPVERLLDDTCNFLTSQSTISCTYSGSIRFGIPKFFFSLIAYSLESLLCP